MEQWRPPGKNCGLCGSESCEGFLRAVTARWKEYCDCPFYAHDSATATQVHDTRHSGCDVLGHPYDFVLEPLPGEPSARKIVLPFRSDSVDRLTIRPGDHVVGRPMGAGCPIPHVLEVVEAESATGLLYTWVVGPRYSREHDVKDVRAYHMIGFEGMAARVIREPAPGCRATFLPGFCMMNLNHTGLINMVLRKSSGIHVRIEDIRILAAKD